MLEPRIRPRERPEEHEERKTKPKVPFIFSFSFVLFVPSWVILRLVEATEVAPFLPPFHAYRRVYEERAAIIAMHLRKEPNGDGDRREDD